MIVLELAARHSEGRGPMILLAAIGGGLLGAGSVAVINFASTAEQVNASLALGLVFLAALVLMYVCNRWAARAIVASFEQVQFTLRAQLAEGLRRAPLRVVETFSEQHRRAIGDLGFISSVSTQLFMLALHAAFLVSVTFIIMAISVKALLIWLGTCVVIAMWLLPRLRELGEQQTAHSAEGGALDASVEELLNGFKQLKLDPEAGDQIVADIIDKSTTFYTSQTRLAFDTDRAFFVSMLIFFSLGFGLTVFAPAGGLGLGPELGYEMVVMLGLSLGPLLGLLQSLPVLTKVDASARAIVEVLGLLADSRASVGGVSPASFETVELRGVAFHYQGEGPGFSVGPLDLSLRPGELVFVTGGNGSGKTTLMKMLLGLYPCDGELRLNGQIVGEQTLEQYRGLFTSIFAQPFCFDRLYGLDVERERVEATLERFGIAEVVRFDGRRFGQLRLSSGQRMRLAMVVALLEDRPICVFDEWTANQDPQTTWMYYETLLPQLVAAGKTVIAVSHDDRFFDRADHLIALERGRIVTDQTRGES